MTKRRDRRLEWTLGAMLGLVLVGACGGEAPDEGPPKRKAPLGLESVDSCGDGNACGPGEACEGGVCLGTGLLQITATWSRSGDADLYVVTPGDRLIHYANPGPDADTEFGELDADVQTGTGPENIFWAVGRYPPVGTYRVCLAAASFDPAPSPANPLGYTVRVRRPGKPDFITTGSFTQSPSSWGCTFGGPTYVTSFGLP